MKKRNKSLILAGLCAFAISSMGYAADNTGNSIEFLKVNTLLHTGVADSNVPEVTGSDSIGIGAETVVEGTSSVGIGYQTVANGHRNVVIGNQATDKQVSNQSTGRDVVAIGTKARAAAVNSIAIGNGANASTVNGVAIGKDTMTDGLGALAIGESAKGLSSGISIGKESQSEKSISIGAETVSVRESVAIGDGAKVEGIWGVSLGRNATISNDSTMAAVAVGGNSVVSATNGSALGYGTSVTEPGAVAIGVLSSAADKETTIGYALTAEGEKSPGLSTLIGADKNTELQELAAARKNLTVEINSLTTQVETLKADLKTAANAEDKTRISNDIKIKEGEIESKTAERTANIMRNNSIVGVWKPTSGQVSIGNAEKGVTRQITNVAAGDQDTDAVNVAQLKQAAIKIAANKENINAVDGKTDQALEKAASAEKIAKVADSEAKKSADMVNTLKKSFDDAGLVSGMATGEKAMAIGGNSIASAENAIAIGPDSIADRANSVSFGSKGSERTLTNVAPGKIAANSTDAVNGSQLFETNRRIESTVNQVNAVDNRLDEVGALSAAMSGLKPMYYDGHEKGQIMAGLGVFHGSRALALGYGYTPNAKTFVYGSVGATSREQMYNLGVTFRIGSGIAGRHSAEVPDVKAMQDTIVEQKSTIANLQSDVMNLKSENADLKARLDSLTAQVASFIAK